MPGANNTLGGEEKGQLWLIDLVALILLELILLIAGTKPKADGIVAKTHNEAERLRSNMMG